MHIDYMRLLRVLPRHSRTSPVIALPGTRRGYQTLSSNHLNFLPSQPRLRFAATSGGMGDSKFRSDCDAPRDTARTSSRRSDEWE